MSTLKLEKFAELVKIAANSVDKQAFLLQSNSLVDYYMDAERIPVIGLPVSGYRRDGDSKIGYQTSPVEAVYRYKQTNLFVAMTANSLIIAKVG